MKILLLGNNGQLGWELSRSLAPLGSLVSLGKDKVDFTCIDSLRRVVNDIKPDWIVNAVAFTDVDKAELEPELAYSINLEAVRALAEESSRLGAWLVHFSTDYIFDGKKTHPYTESDLANPLSIYGKSKLAADQAIEEACEMYLIFRISWIFSDRGKNFAKTILRLAREKNEISVVSDEQGAPTSAELVADVTSLCIREVVLQKEPKRNKYVGTFNLTSSGYTSWFGLANYILQNIDSSQLFKGKKLPVVKEISSFDYQSTAIRPRNSRLNTEKIQNKFSIMLPHWTVYIDRFLKEINLEEL